MQAAGARRIEVLPSNRWLTGIQQTGAATVARHRVFYRSRGTRGNRSGSGGNGRAKGRSGLSSQHLRPKRYLDKHAKLGEPSRSIRECARPSGERVSMPKSGNAPGRFQCDGRCAQFAARNSVVLLHACCHNPTGADLTPSQWDRLSISAAPTGCCRFDFAYQGVWFGN